MNIAFYQAQAKANRKRYKKLLQQLKRKKDNYIDGLFRAAHHAVFEQIDCLQCGNCCKTTGPLFTQKDIVRIAKHLKLSPGAFVEKYLCIDEDGDYVFRQLPCAFIDAENYCAIYEVRPKACSQYPHTDRAKQVQVFPLTIKNVEICPAVYRMLEQIAEQIERK